MVVCDAFFCDADVDNNNDGVRKEEDGVHWVSSLLLNIIIYRHYEFR